MLNKRPTDLKDHISTLYFSAYTVLSRNLIFMHLIKLHSGVKKILNVLMTTPPPLPEILQSSKFYWECDKGVEMALGKCTFE